MVRLDIDLAFSETEQGQDADTPPFEGTITAAGTEVRIVVSDPSRLPGNGRRTLTELSTVADALASRGISVRLEGPDGPILHLGDVKKSALQRAITGSAHIRLGSVAAVAPLLTRRNKGQALTFPIPPETPLPLVPTVNRTVRRRITTTHYTPGSGRPRLIFAVGDSSWDGSRPREFDLLPTTTVIGSGEGADLRLPGLAPVHAEIRHEGDDEYVLYGFDAVGAVGRASRAPGRSRRPDSAHRSAHRARRLAPGVLPRRVRRPRPSVRRTPGRRVVGSAQAAAARRHRPAQPGDRPGVIAGA